MIFIIGPYGSIKSKKQAASACSLSHDFAAHYRR